MHTDRELTVGILRSLHANTNRGAIRFRASWIEFLVYLAYEIVLCIEELTQLSRNRPFNYVVPGVLSPRSMLKRTNFFLAFRLLNGISETPMNLVDVFTGLLSLIKPTVEWPHNYCSPFPTTNIK